MKRVAFFALLPLACISASADPAPVGLPDFSIDKSCAIFAGHPRTMALCEDTETHFRTEVTGSWPRAPVPGRERCSQLASQSERGKYEVLARCLRAAMREAAWQDIVGSIKP